MKFKSITSDEFASSKRGRKSGYRTQVLDEIKKIASNTKNKGQLFQVDLPEKMSLSTWQYLRKQLLNEKIIKEIGYVANKDNKKEIEAVTFACN